MRSIVRIAVVAALLAAGSQVVFAQQTQSGKPDPATFAERKARIQKMMEERKTWLETEKACVDKASNDEELIKCRPQRPMRGGQGMGGQMGGPGPRGPMGGPGGM